MSWLSQRRNILSSGVLGENERHLAAVVIHHWSASHSTPGFTLPARHFKPQSTRSRLEEVFCWNLQTKFHPRALFWSLQQDGNKSEGVVVFSSLSSPTLLFLVFGVVWPLKIPCSPNYSVIPWFMSCFCSLLHSALRRKITQQGELFLSLYTKNVSLYKRFSIAILISFGYLCMTWVQTVRSE